jgi:hypothetical protein
MRVMSAPLLIIFASAALCLAQEPGGRAHPPLQLHPLNGHYLLFRGRPTILVGSGEHYGAVMNLDFDYIRYLDEIEANGLNLTRTFSGTYREIQESFGITDNPLAPRHYLAPWERSDETAPDGGKFDLTRFSKTYFERLQDFVAQAGRRGIVVEYVLFCPFYSEKLWTANPMNSANNVNGVGRCRSDEVYTLLHGDLLAIQEAFVRKAVDELNRFDNVYFEICNEPYFGGVRDDWQARIARLIAATESRLPNRHLIAQNIANGRKRIERPDPNVSVFNFHYATPPDTVAENYHLSRVLSDDETGFRGRDDMVYRTEGWDFLVAGGGIYSNLDYSFTPLHPDGTLAEFSSPGGGGRDLRRQLRILKDFMGGFDFIRMEPHNEVITGGSVAAPLAGNPAQTLVTARVLAEPGVAYAVYVRGGNSVELQILLPAGSYRAEWVDTKTGATVRSETFDHTRGTRKLASPPYSQDIALRLVSGIKR